MKELKSGDHALKQTKARIHSTKSIKSILERVKNDKLINFIGTNYHHWQI